MSDLFEVPESPLPPLEAARRRLARAMDAWHDADAACQENVRCEVDYALKLVRELEQEAMRK